ncbi:MAG: exodeoxyribonuclease VII small subunit [Erysipelotrichaceae bacterium]|nr:exodeoxyribonuclease VII small subunit [Erysipelotrichaceae bacterium]
MAENKTKKVSFEDKLKRLDQIVKAIEEKTLSLDESIKLYEEGSKIIVDLEAALKEAESKVESVITK